MSCYEVVTLTVGVVCPCHQELFFGVTAEDAAADQEAQSCVSRMLESMCPPEGSTGTCFLNPASTSWLEMNNLSLRPPVSSGERPWLRLCLVSYSAEDDVGQEQTCYQICPSALATPS